MWFSTITINVRSQFNHCLLTQTKINKIVMGIMYFSEHSELTINVNSIQKKEKHHQ